MDLSLERRADLFYSAMDFILYPPSNCGEKIDPYTALSILQYICIGEREVDNVMLAFGYTEDEIKQAREENYLDYEEE